MQRILINLLSNAIKFTKQGHVKISTTLTEFKKRNVIVTFKIEDTGIGIPQDKCELIFEKFVKLDLSNRCGLFRGSGLGLYLVKQFVQELGGEIEVQSELGKGSIFISSLPFRIPLLNKQD